MRKLFVLLSVVLVSFAVIHRHRIYVWDPLASVTRDGVEQRNVRVMINFDNEALIDDGSTAVRRLYLAQHWSKAPIYPLGPLRCLEYLACMTEADQAGGQRLLAGSRGRRSPYEGVTMTDRRVKFVDENGALLEVVLR